MFNRSSLVSILLSTALLSAQSTISPAAYKIREGNTVNGLPLGALTMRHMQIHGDLRQNQGFTVSGLRFRRDGASNLDTGRIRQLDIEVLIAPSNHTKISPVFANNYAAPPTTVFKRKVIWLPAWNMGPSIGPKTSLLFDTKWWHAGTQDLAWEMRVYGNSLNAVSGMPTDAFDSTIHGIGARRMIGTGCTTRQGTMTLLSECVSNSQNGMISLQWLLAGGPKSMPGVLLIGLVNVQAKIRHLCGDGMLRTVAQIIVPVTTGNGGAAATSKVWFPFWPGLTGQKLYAQQIHSDRHQNGLFFAVSNGMETRIPSPSAGRLPISRLMTTNVNASSGTISANYGVVTEFMH
ncbi:MAG: hypothetical protein QF412_06540 [Planctomycetota bacterium]|jgi:hypothetical protein|nr:hypothetical protein [Planctomycetota bacterium]